MNNIVGDNEMTITETGVYEDVPNETYHADPHSVSNTDLGLILRSPRIYYHRRLDPNRPPEKERQGQLEGTLAHTAILEPDKFDQQFVIGPTANRNTKLWKDFVADNPDRTAIQQDQADKAQAQARSVRRIPDVAEALDSGWPELSCYWRDEETGVLCRCRPDWTHPLPAGDVLIDVKTVGDADPGELARQVARKGYHRQQAMYKDGREQASGRNVIAFIFVGIEDEWPYEATAVMLDEESQEAGHRIYRHALQTYATCIETDVFPGHSDSIEVIRLPEYAINR